MSASSAPPGGRDASAPSLLAAILERRRLVTATALFLALAGGLSWLTMPREEDPTFPRRNALMVTAFPGADAETIERLVVEPLEEHLAEVEEVDNFSSTARAGVAILAVELLDHIYDTASAWDEVEDALALARAEFPAGVGEPMLDDDLVSQEAIVLAITGSSDPLVLARAAEGVKRELLALEPVKQVKLVADPGEQITIEYDDAVARRLELDPRRLGMTLSRRSSMQPGGVIHLGSKTANLRPRTEFESLEEIRSTPVLLSSGSAVPLSQLAKVRHGPAEPAVERMRWHGEPAVGLGVIPKDRLDRVDFGRQVRQRVEEIRSRFEPLMIEEVFFQPDQVEHRLRQLTGSLKLGILIVAGVLFLAMGPRLGILVALVVPLVAFCSIAIFAAGGGILNQISIAALVIALGMLVDNAIVVSENIQWRLDRGLEIRQAAVTSVRELALPLGTATGTTLAAFVPMLRARGATADFTRGIPVVIMLTLTVSYVFAVLVTPVLSEIFLRRRQGSREDRTARLARHVSRVAVRWPGSVLAGAAVLLALSIGAAGRLDQHFFPAADSNLMIVDLEMPEGTHLEQTDAVTRRLEAALAARREVGSVAAFVGRAAPKFYYNLLSRPRSPHRAQLVVETDSLEAVERVIAWVRDHARNRLPEVEVVARRLEQGPPVEAPIEIRVMGSTFEDLELAADTLLGELRAIAGTRDVRHDLGLGVPTVVFEIDDAAAGRHGLTRSDVAAVLRGRTLGHEIGQYRVGDDPVPILVRSSAGEQLPAADLATLDVAAPGGRPVPLAELARLRVEWRPAAIYHYDRSRNVKVLAQLGEGLTTAEVFEQLEPRIEALQLPPGVRLELGGELEESGAANDAMLSAMPLGLLLLLFFLLAEFNSFRRVGIVLVTVPLAAIGVVPGLLLSGQPFGFTAMLGLISLVGIVVNNAIVLLDVVDKLRAEGMALEKALCEAVRRRTRPILLTMATTVAGLTPLAFSGTTLWPPLAWAMISGLIASTLLTLLVIPALYKLLLSERQRPFSGGLLRRRASAAAILLIMISAMFFAVTEARAVENENENEIANENEPAAHPAISALALSLEQAIERATARPRARAAEARAEAAEHGAAAERRAALWPTLSVALEAKRRDRDFALSTPIGGFVLGERASDSTAVEIVQPLLDPARLFFRSKAARSDATAAASAARRTRQQLATEASRSFLSLLAIDARRRSTDAFIASLEAGLREMEERVGAGRTLEADALKVRLDLESAELDRQVLEQARQVASYDLGRAVGHDGPVEPRFDGEIERGGEVSTAELLASALVRRPDVGALSAQLQALELRARAVKAERYPRLVARATFVSSSGDPFLPEDQIEGGISVSWKAFAAGTRGPRAAALEAERRALAAELTELRRAIEIEIRTAVTGLENARAAARVRRRGVELATETLRVERERNRAGRATTNDLLDAEAALHRQRTQSELARLDILRAWFNLALAAGVEDLAEL